MRCLIRSNPHSFTAERYSRFYSPAGHYFIEAGAYSEVHTVEETVISYKKLETVLQELPPEFSMS